VTFISAENLSENRYRFLSLTAVNSLLSKVQELRHAHFFQRRLFQLRGEADHRGKYQSQNKGFYVAPVGHFSILSSNTSPHK
jgi:hypothetical protein